MLSIVLFMLAVLLITPMILVLISPRSHGGAKFGWFVGTLIFSWVGYAAFLIITQKEKDRIKADKQALKQPIV